MIILSVPQNGFFFSPNWIFHMLSFFILRNIAWFYPTWPMASKAEHQTKFGDNSGGKLLLKFGETQGAQDIKTAKSYRK